MMQKQKNQILLNTLEDETTRYAPFLPFKINEGWDVLNLFDIVRLTKGVTVDTENPRTTISEAQLIGRGADILALEEGQDKYTENLMMIFPTI